MTLNHGSLRLIHNTFIQDGLGGRLSVAREPVETLEARCSTLGCQQEDRGTILASLEARGSTLGLLVDRGTTLEPAVVVPLCRRVASAGWGWTCVACAGSSR